MSKVIGMFEKKSDQTANQQPETIQEQLIWNKHHSTKIWEELYQDL